MSHVASHRKTKKSKLNAKNYHCSYVYSVFKMVLWSHSKIYGSIIYIYIKKPENQHTVYIFLKNTHAYQKKKKEDGVGDKPSECQQQLFLGGGITCDF